MKNVLFSSVFVIGTALLLMLTGCTEEQLNKEDLAPVRDLKSSEMFIPSPTGNNGSKIVFNNDMEGNPEIYVVNIYGSNLRNLTNHPVTDHYAAISTNGQNVAFVSRRDGNEEIYRVNIDGSEMTRLTHNMALDRHPRFSRNGKKIVFCSNREAPMSIYTMNIDGTNIERLTDFYSFTPDISNNGKEILFARGTGQGMWEICKMDIDGENLIQLTTLNKKSYFPTWSPDGKKILFISNPGNNWDVFTMDTDGSNILNLTEHPATDGKPSWSHDGKHIIFTSFRDGSPDLYIMDADGSEVTKFSDGPGGYFYPVWGPGRVH